MRTYEIIPGLTLTPDALYSLRSIDVVMDTGKGTQKTRIFFNPSTNFLSYLVDGAPRALIIGGRCIQRTSLGLDEIDVGART